MRRILKWSWRLFAGLLTLVLLGAVAAYIAARSSLPDYDGRMELEGLERPVTVIRDANAIPHIHAETDADAYFALGFVHAQDRLFQMEMMRRIGAGRVAEAIGEPGIRIDRFMRTLGLYRLAQTSYERSPAEGKAALDAYAAGVNAYLEHRDGLLPPEFLLAGIDPEPWTPADSLVWGRLMGLNLSTNWMNELLRMRMLEIIGAERMRVLWPEYPADAPVTLTDWRQAASDIQPARMLAALPKSMIGTGASNEWVVSGSQSATGAPLLANDPHLGMNAPILWYLARIKTPGMDVTGVTVPGVPLHVLGHNERIAWGFTTTYIDTDDLFIERVDPQDPERYVTPDGSLKFDVRREIIKVAGGDDVEIVIRSTRHGPVLSDLPRQGGEPTLPEGHVAALSAPWLREDDETPLAIYYMNRARDWESFTRALRRYGAPIQNIVYADVDGNIGFYAPGRVPVRRNSDGFLPAPGWTRNGGWRGFIPFEQLPHAFNPESGRFFNSNNRIVGPDYPYHLSDEWGDRYRAARVEDLLEPGNRPFTIEYFARMQGDNVSYMARALLPLMLRNLAPEGEIAGHAAEMLRSWDGTMDRRRPEPLIFTVWLAELNVRLYGDELSAIMDRYRGLRPEVVRNILTEHPEWCDDERTSRVEGCDEQVNAAFAQAIQTLLRQFGTRAGDWRWGDVHYADLRHRVFDLIPVIRDFANLRIETDGGTYTVNKAQMNIRDRRAPYAQRHGPGYRAIFDLSNLARSRFVITTGQSGHPLSRYYDNMLERWRDVRYFHISQSAEGAREGAIGTLVLSPRETETSR